MPTLNETQALLWKLITAPEGAAAGLATLSAQERAVYERLVRADEQRRAGLSAIERVDIYADMYFYRIRDALKEDFATVAAVIGDARFHNLITDYLLAHPPVHFSLRYAGQHLPAFLGEHACSEQWPYLPDLAALEWSILEAFDAPDASVLDIGALQAVPAERWPLLRFRLTPSLRQLHLHWTVHETWQRSQRGESLGEPCHENTALRVWRQDYRVFQSRMDPTETAALTALVQGAPFADVCEQIATEDITANGAERAFNLLAGWVNDGLLTTFEFGVL